MSLPDMLGVFGVGMTLVAYALAQLGRLRVDRAPSLLMNLGGSMLILLSLSFRFNLSAVLMEAAWGLVALFGLVKLAVNASR
jgi:hypothetical protein